MSLPAKLLIFLLIVAGVAATSLWIIGGKKNEYSTSLLINAQPQQVFPYLTQPEHLKSWIDGLTEVSELVKPPEEKLPTPAVTTLRVFQNENGKQVRFQDEIIRFDPNKLVSVQSRNRSHVVTSIYQLELKDDNKTSLTYRVKKANRGIGRFFAPLNQANIQEQMENDARRLKELVEKNQTPDSENGLDSAADDSTPQSETGETTANSEQSN